jgi:hypothetical protein
MAIQSVTSSTRSFGSATQRRVRNSPVDLPLVFFALGTMSSHWNPGAADLRNIVPGHSHGRQPQRPEARRLLTRCFPFGERLARAAKQIRSTSASTARFALVLEVRGGRFSSGAGAAASSLTMAAWIAHAATGSRSASAVIPKSAAARICRHELARYPDRFASSHSTNPFAVREGCPPIALASRTAPRLAALFNWRYRFAYAASVPAVRVGRFVLPGGTLQLSVVHARESAWYRRR